MTAPEHARAKDLFLQALELSEDERGSLLERLAREDPELVRQVRELLEAHHGAAAAQLEHLPAVFGAALAGASPPAGGRLGDYELLEEVASGASGTVWRARQVALDRIVALKVLRAGRLASTQELERLRAEAEAVARLDHPGIVPVYEVGTHDGQAFFSMRWVEGGTLARQLTERWAYRKGARLLIEVARAVHHAHQRGLLHRDLKPTNVLMDASGKPHVADFGIAKRLENGAHATTTRNLAGTPPYMAPEQIEGGELTVATDVWALGCLLYELLAGRPAFLGGTVSELLYRICHEDPPLLRADCPDVPRDLETIVAVCLRREPVRRYASAAALADDLERWLVHEPIAARRTSAWERLTLFARRSPLAASLIATVLGLLVLLAGVALWANVQLGAQLRASYLGQARATRLSGAVGGRATALGLLEQAAAIRPGADLCDEAIACLALTDLMPLGSVALPADERGPAWVDPRLELAAQDVGGHFQVRRFDDASLVSELEFEQPVRFARWSPRGRWLLGKFHDPNDQAKDATFRVWEAGLGRVHLTRAMAIAHRAAAFAPDEQSLALGTLANELVVLDLEHGTERLRVPLACRPRVLCFSPDGSRVALALVEEFERIEVREARTGTLLVERDLDTFPFDLDWSEHGLMVAGGDFRIHVLDGEDLHVRAVCEGHSAEATEVFAAARLPLVMSNSWDGTARLWDATSGRELRRLSAKAMGFGPDGLEIGLGDDSVWGRWRVAYGDFLDVLQAHSGKSPVSLCFSPEASAVRGAAGGQAARTVASSGTDGVYLWDGRLGSRPHKVSEIPARSVRFLPDGSGLWLAGEEGLARFDLDVPSESQVLLTQPLWRVSQSADGRTLAVVTTGAIHLLDPDAHVIVRTLRGSGGLEFLSLSADGSRIASGNWRGLGVHVWDLRRGEESRLFLPDQRNVAPALSPDGRLLATATSQRLELWDLETGERRLQVERWRNLGNAPPPLVFSPDGALLAFGISSDVVRLIDTRTLESAGTLEAPHHDSMFELAFSPDGTVLGATCATNRIKLWKLAELRRELEARGLVRAR